MGVSPAQSRTVLLVDDDFGVRKTLEFYFKSKGWRVIPAKSGAEGVVLAGTEQFDLLISDYRMQDMGGAEVCRAVSSHWPGPIIMISGWLDAQAEALVRKAGATHVVHKPFSIDEMDQALREIFGAPSS